MLFSYCVLWLCCVHCRNNMKSKANNPQNCILSVEIDETETLISKVSDAPPIESTTTPPIESTTLEGKQPDASNSTISTTLGSNLSYDMISTLSTTMKSNLPNDSITRSNFDENVNKCEVCGKGFARKDHLKSHLRKHSGEMLDCPICPRKFYDKSSLKEHHRVIHENVRYTCDSCSKSFSSKTGLVRHCQAVHIKHFYWANFSLILL